MFGYNGLGFSFEIQVGCQVLKMPVKCGVRFNNLTIPTFDAFPKSKLTPNPDIAGIGVSVRKYFNMLVF